MGISQDRGLQFEERLLDFAYSVIQLTRTAGNGAEYLTVKNQLLRSATAIGANYAEANNAASRQDFRNKIFIAKKEAAETRYWLKLLRKMQAELPKLDQIINECSELLMILQKIISTLKTHPR